MPPTPDAYALNRDDVALRERCHCVAALTERLERPALASTDGDVRPITEHSSLRRPETTSSTKRLGVSIFELARVMGTSGAMIDRTYEHLAGDSKEAIRARLEAKAERSGDEVASASPE